MPIIQSYIDNMPNCRGYLEPFVGGANMIDKIKCPCKIGNDVHKYLIALLNHVSETTDDLPDTITEEEYDAVRTNPDNYPDWYVGLVGFCASYNGKWFGGYANGVKTKIGTVRNYTDEAIRNIKKQAPNLKGIEFSCCDYCDASADDMVVYCFDKDTEVLTNNGWKFFKDVNINEDLFLSREPNTKQLEWVDAIRYINYHYFGKMYLYKGRHIDICVTDNHNIFGSRLVGRNKMREEFLMKATDFASLPNNRTFVKAGGKWVGTKVDMIDVCGSKFDTLKFARLLGIFLTDGCVNNQGSITISQSKTNIVKEISELLNDLEIEHSTYIPTKGRDIYTFYISRKYLPFFEQFYIKENRHVPEFIKNASVDIISQFIEGVLDGDSDNERRKIFIESKSLADDIQECLFKIGKAGNIKEMSPKDSYLKKENRWIHGTKPYYIVSILNTEYPEQVKDNVKWIDYDDEVYCVTLSKWHTVLTRRNGNTVWMGQCDPPYRDTTKYATGGFDYDKFYAWCKEMAKNNVVLISEYWMPEDGFECIWEGKLKCTLDKASRTDKTEKLYRCIPCKR